MQNDSTRKLYDDTVESLLDGVLEGYHATVIAYGATNCGKTYTYSLDNSEWSERMRSLGLWLIR